MNRINEPSRLELEAVLFADLPCLESTVHALGGPAHEMREQSGDSPASSLTAMPLADQPVAIWEIVANWADIVATRELPLEEMPLVLY